MEVAPEQQRAIARTLLLAAQSLRIGEHTTIRMVDVLRGGNEPRDLARALELAGHAAAAHSHSVEAEAYLREGWELFEQLGDRAGRARCARALGEVLIPTRKAEAERWLLEARDLAREIDDWYEEGNSVLGLADLHAQAGDFARASVLADVARHRFQQLRSMDGLALANLMLSWVLFSGADLMGARREALKAAQLFNEVGLPNEEAQALLSLAAIDLSIGRAPDAMGSLQLAADLLFQAKDTSGLSQCIRAAQMLPEQVLPERDAFIAATEARIASLRAGADQPSEPTAPPPDPPATPAPADPPQ